MENWVVHAGGIFLQIHGDFLGQETRLRISTDSSDIEERNKHIYSLAKHLNDSEQNAKRILELETQLQTAKSVLHEINILALTGCTLGKESAAENMPHLMQQIRSKSNRNLDYVENIKC